MQLTAELSMYPLKEDYIPAIKGFIDWLGEHDDVVINTGATCTTVTGDYDRVMGILHEGFKLSRERYGKAIFVAKFLPGFDAQADGE